MNLKLNKFQGSVRKLSVRPAAGGEVKEGSGEWLFMLPKRVVSIGNIRREIELALGELSSSVLEVKERHNVKVGNLYFLIKVANGKGAVCLEKLRQKSKRLGWFVREDRKWEERVKGQKQMPIDRSASAVKYLSLNINGLSVKKAEAGLMCAEKKVDVLFLQETLWKNKGWNLTFPNYTIIGNERVDGEAGARGVAVAVKNGILALDTEVASKFCVFVKVLLDGQMTIAGSVYIPTKRAGSVRREAKAEVRHCVGTLRSRYPHIPMILGGDWNMDRGMLIRLLKGWDLGLMAVEFSGSNLTRRAGKSMSAIDHFVVSQLSGNVGLKARVDRSWDLSDHWPIMLAVGGSKVAESSKQKMEIRGPLAAADRKSMNLWADVIVDDNRFAALADEISGEEDIEAGIEGFIKVSGNIAEEVGILGNSRSNRNKNGKVRKCKLSNKTIREVNKRRKLASKLALLESAQDVDVEEVDSVRTSYQAAKKRCKALAKEDLEKSWKAYLEKGMSYMRENQYKKFWAWLKTLSTRGGARQKSGVIPIRDSEGNLMLEPEKIKAAWAAHFGALCADSEGISRDAGHWAGLVDEDVEELEGINQPVTWPEVAETIKALKNGKASGVSGIPAEWFKLTLEDEPREDPESAMGMVVFKLVKLMVENASIPEKLNRALLVTIPKKGDLTLMDNYRGISLLEVLLKIASTVVIKRISRALEEKGVLVAEQAGFRPKQECSAQVLSLVEVCKRRQLAGLETYVAFLDFKKAYDMVPHEALFAKLRGVGIKGMCLKFIQAVYANSRVAVALADGLTPEVPFLRGSRQGCPMSPTLFDVFINDIFVDLYSLGVAVPGMEGKIPGLLYADDSGLCAESRDDLQEMLDVVGNWATKWGMSFGIAKCGVFVVNGDMETLKENPPTLHGAVLPVVDKYTYLGVPLNSEMNLDKVVSDREVKAKAALETLRGMLSNKLVPLGAKLTALKNCLHPVVCFGGEVLGMNQMRVAGLQSVLNSALRTVVGVSATACAPEVLHKELGVSSVHETMSGAKARAIKKYVSLPTWAGKLVEDKNSLVNRKRTLVSGAKQWMRTFGKADMRKALKLSGRLAERRCTRIARKVCRRRDWRRAVNNSATAKRYDEAGFHRTRKYVRISAGFPRVALGVRELVRARTGSLWTGRRAARAGLIGARFKEVCPCCEQMCGGEGLSHLLFQCDRWMKQRGEMLSGLSRGLSDALGVEDDAVRVRLLLGGSEDAALRRAWVGGSAGEGQVGDWLAVATFLQTVCTSRNGLIWRNRIFPSMDRRPDG
jgi:exonuclease III